MAQRVYPMISQKIVQLVCEGVTNAQEVKKTRIRVFKIVQDNLIEKYKQWKANNQDTLHFFDRM